MCGIFWLPILPEKCAKLLDNFSSFLKDHCNSIRKLLRPKSLIVGARSVLTRFDKSKCTTGRS